MNTKRPFEEKYNFCKETLLMNTNGDKFLELSRFKHGEGMFYNYIA